MALSATFGNSFQIQAHRPAPPALVFVFKSYKAKAAADKPGAVISPYHGQGGKVFSRARGEHLATNLYDSCTNWSICQSIASM